MLKSILRAATAAVAVLPLLGGALVAGGQPASAGEPVVNQPGVIKLAATDSCLSAVPWPTGDTRPALRDPVFLHRCDGFSGGQTWRVLQHATTGAAVYQHVWTGSCLDVPADGRLVLTPCDFGDAGQVWERKEGDDDGTYVLKNVLYGHLLDTEQGGTTDLTRAVVGPLVNDTPTQTQVWTLPYARAT